MEIDLSVAQLLCSRVCHDMVGPVGAINTGLELIEDGSAADATAALAMMTGSADEARRRLAFFRVAFGLGGGADGPPTLEDARALAAGYLAGGKVALDWPMDDATGPAGGDAGGPPEAAKAVLNMVLIASGALPRGGAVTVRVNPLDGGLGVAVTAAGEGAGVADDVALALALEAGAAADALTVRNVHGHFAQCLARAAGGAIELTAGGQGEVRLAALFAAGPAEG